MKSWIAAAALAAAAFFGATAHAQEQDQRWGGGGPGWGQLPSGSYQQTCRDARVNGGMLTASCQDSRGRWNYSSLNFRDCRSDIGNNNGRLSCQWGGGGGGGGGPGWGQIPSGSYQQTCRDARVSGNTLTASCQDSRGRWNYSTLNFRDCRSDIGNDNGRLSCQWGGGGGGGPGWGQLPSGSYQQTCRDARVNGSTLTASCQDGIGRWNYSTLNFRDCRGDIGNDNGRLTCRGGGGGGGIGQSTLMLYSAADYGGQAYQATREVTNLPRQFNDRAMSLRIQGRGAWQVCSDSDFRGRCQIFDRDVSDLRQYGLGEAITSMRPMNDRPY